LSDATVSVQLVYRNTNGPEPQQHEVEAVKAQERGQTEHGLVAF